MSADVSVVKTPPATPGGPLVRSLGHVGRGTRGVFVEVGNMARLLAGMAAEMGDTMARGRFPIRRGELFAQTDRVGVGSVPLVGMVSLFIGLTMSLLIGAVLRTYGTERLVPTLIATAFARELGPLMTGIVMAARIGAAFTAELGTMTVSEEVEAIEAMGLGPLRFLVAPRLLAITLLMPCLVVVSNVAAIAGAYAISTLFLGISGGYFFDLVREGLTVSDVLFGSFKALVFGLIIGLVACHRGLTVKGGAAGVGIATTGSVVSSVTTVIGVDTLFNVVKQVVFPN